MQRPDSYNCLSLHSYGAYQYSVDGTILTSGTTNSYADIEVNAGEKITFSVKARNTADLMSNAATVVITGPDAGQ